jgi:hypothetical protein
MYRKFANDCIDRAQSAPDFDAAAGLIRMAQYWLAKADSPDRNPVYLASTFRGNVRRSRLPKEQRAERLGVPDSMPRIDDAKQSLF